MNFRIWIVQNRYVIYSFGNGEKSALVFCAKQAAIYVEAKIEIKSTHDLAAEFDVGDLIFSDWHDQRDPFLAVDNNIGGLQDWIAEEAVGVQVLVFHVFESFLVSGNAL